MARTALMALTDFRQLQPLRKRPVVRQFQSPIVKVQPPLMLVMVLMARTALMALTDFRQLQPLHKIRVRQQLVLQIKTAQQAQPFMMV